MEAGILLFFLSHMETCYYENISDMGPKLIFNILHGVIKMHGHGLMSMLYMQSGEAHKTLI